jgi:hypothetical protein
MRVRMSISSFACVRDDWEGTRGGLGSQDDVAAEHNAAADDASFTPAIAIASDAIRFSPQRSISICLSVCYSLLTMMLMPVMNPPMLYALSTVSFTEPNPKVKAIQS